MRFPVHLSMDATDQTDMTQVLPGILGLVIT